MTLQTALYTSQKVIKFATGNTLAIVRRSIHISNNTTTSRNISVTKSQSQSHHLICHGVPAFSIPSAIAVAATDDRSLHYLLTRHSRYPQYPQYPQQKRASNVAQCEAPDHAPLSNTMEMVVLHNDDRKMIRRIVRRIQTWASTVWDAVLVLMRTSEVAIRLSPLVILTPVAMILTPNHSTALNAGDESHAHNSMTSTSNPSKYTASDLAWKYTNYTIQKLGPVFVKLSQWAATRRDIFPERTCDRLSELHSRTTLHSWAHTKKILEEGGFGDCKHNGSINGEEEGGGIVLKVDREDILGSGCVAQVYRGTLGGNGNRKEMDVAVKVLHPNMLERTERDLLLMKRIANLLDSLPFETIKMLSLPRAIDNFSSILRHQVDLRIEGQNLLRFRSNFLITDEDDTNYNSSASKISFPNPLLVKPNCLVEQLVTDNDSGGSSVEPITNLLADNTERGMEIRRKVAGPLLRAFLKMVFIDNFVHCDLHPGNVLIRRQKKKKPSPPLSFISWFADNATTTPSLKSMEEEVEEQEEYSIIFLDAGIVMALQPQDQQNLQDLFRAILLNEGHTAGRLMVERARYERCSQIPGGIDAFSNGIAAIVAEFHDRRKKGGGLSGLTLGIVGIGTLLNRVLGLCREFRVEIDPAMANVVMSTMVLEGLGRSLDENLNLIECAIPFVLGGGKV